MFLCKKGTILLRSLFHTLDGLGRALIKGSIEGLNMNLSSFRRNANLWKLAEHCITCRWDTQLLQEEHVLQCSRRSSPSWVGSSRCPTNKDGTQPNAMSSTSPPPRTSCAIWWCAPLQLHSKPLPFTLVQSDPEGNTRSCRDRGKGRQH